MSQIYDPIIIEPTGFTTEQGWDECQQYVEDAGELEREGKINWRAAFGADPGVCTCPNCHLYYWSFGTLIECRECHFQFPTDWWPMYSYGVNAARRIFSDDLHRERLQDPYYRYGFEHPVTNPWEQHDKIDWKKELASVCRRCVECEGMTHHWIPNFDYGNDEVSQNLANAEHICKHCGSLGYEP